MRAEAPARAQGPAYRRRPPLWRVARAAAWALHGLRWAFAWALCGGGVLGLLAVSCMSSRQKTGTGRGRPWLLLPDPLMFRRRARRRRRTGRRYCQLSSYCAKSRKARSADRAASAAAAAGSLFRVVQKARTSSELFTCPVGRSRIPALPAGASSAALPLVVHFLSESCAAHSLRSSTVPTRELLLQGWMMSAAAEQPSKKRRVRARACKQMHLRH